MSNTIDKLRKNLKKSNDDYHEAVDDVLKANGLYVEHKATIAQKAGIIFKQMEEILAFPLEEKGAKP